MLERIKDIKELVNEILDSLPKSVWSSDSTTFFDPAIGGGQFVAEIERRLRAHGHSDKNIRNRVYGFEYNAALVDLAVNMNKLVGQYAKKPYDKFFEMDDTMKFDVIVGNPPYQATKEGDKRDSAANLWPEFVIKSFALLKENGVIGMVTPNGWMTPSADSGKGKSGIRIFDYMTKFRTLALNINECKRHFSEGSSFTYYVIQKALNTNNNKTKVITEDGTFSVNMAGMQYCPSVFNNISVSLNTKILGANHPVIGFTNNNTSAGLKFGADTSETKTSTHTVKCYDSSANNGTFVYSSFNSPETKKQKVLVCSSGNLLPIYDNGKLGYTNKIYVYNLESKETLDSIESYLSSKLVKVILNQNKTSGWVSYALRLLPKVDFSKKWTDKALYKHFGLTQEEIDYVEANAK
jgi:hypothetical protein